MRSRLSLLACLITALAVPAGAHAATITQPTQGQTVALDPTFTWTMAPNEVIPNVSAAKTPTYDSAAAQGICGGDDNQRATTCHPGFPLPAGTYYAYVQTDDADTGQFYFSPFVRFVVPFVLDWGKSNPWGGDSDVITSYVPHPISLSRPIKPYAQATVSGWLNDPGAKISIGYTVKNGRRTVKSAHHTQTAGGAESWSFEDALVLHHLGGIKVGGRMSCRIAITGDGQSLSKTVTLRNPPKK